MKPNIGCAQDNLQKPNADQGNIRAGDAGAGAENVERIGQVGSAPSAPSGEGRGSERDVRPDNREPAQVPKRDSAGYGSTTRGGTAGAGGTDRVSEPQPAGRGRGNDAAAAPRNREGDAIRAFAKVRFLAMAEELAVDLRSRRATDIYGDDIWAQSIWDEYCYEARNGPTIALVEAWSSLIDPLIADLVERLPYEETVLLTIAEQWQTDLPELDYDEGRFSANPDMIAQVIRAALFRVAIDSEWDASDATDEDEEPG